MLSDLGAALTILGAFDEARDAIDRAREIAANTDNSQTEDDLRLIEKRVEALDRAALKNPRTASPGASATTPAP